MKNNFDILGLGCTAIDYLLRVPHWPEKDCKLQLSHFDKQCGGLTANALVAAARLGARCAFAGQLGADPESMFVQEVLQTEGVSTTLARRDLSAKPIQSFILVDESSNTRTILFHLDGAAGAAADSPTEEAIQSAKVLFVDHYGIEGMIRAAKIARAKGIPVVADLERDEFSGFSELLTLVDHLVLSLKFARKLTGLESPQEVVRALKNPGNSVVVTGGEDGCWWQQNHQEVSHLPAFPCTVVDTTGCGDVFHGAYAAMLAKGLEMKERLLVASAAAAIKAGFPGAQRGAPTRSQTAAFLKSHGLDIPGL